jgi:sugar lactone lactonase YvrE
VDSTGNVYCAANNQVLKTVAGTQTTIVVAGNGTAGFGGDGGPATAAELNEPAGIALDEAGNLYIADSGNNRVRMVNLNSGIITTFAGNGTAGSSGDGGPPTEAELNFPISVAVDGAGRVLIAEYLGERVRAVSPPLNIIVRLPQVQARSIMAGVLPLRSYQPRAIHCGIFGSAETM